MKYKLFLPLAFKKAGTCKKQEDTIYPILDDATAEDRLFVVCNGTGGHGFGDIASRTVCKGLTRSILANLTYDRPFTDELLLKAIESTYGLLANCQINPEQKTGSTFAAILFHRGGCMAAHIGNTVIYQIRPLSNEIIYCSNSQAGNNTSNTPVDNNRMLQPNQEQHLKPEIEHLTDIHQADYFYVCTQGAMENMSEGELMGILASETTTDKEKRDIIVERTKENKNSHAAYLIRVEKVIDEEIDTTRPATTDKPTDRKVVKVTPQRNEDDNEGNSDIQPNRKKVVMNDEDDEESSRWSLNGDRGNGSYVKYIVSGIIAFAFVGVLIYFMFAKSPTNDDVEPNIEMSTKPAQTDSIATAKQPADSPDTTGMAQQPTVDSTKIKAYLAKKAYYEKMKAAQAAALAAQEEAAKEAAAKEQTTSKPAATTAKPAATHTEPAAEKASTPTSTPATQTAAPKE